MNFRRGNIDDSVKLRALALKSWSQFKEDLTSDNWNSLFQTINNVDTYYDLLDNSDCFVCENDDQEVIGMAFLVPSGNPNDIYDAAMCQLRFVSVSPDSRGKKIGEQLTRICIETAVKNKEQLLALHTSEIMKSARHIYEKIGFKILKEIEPRLGVKYWLYTLDLNEFSNHL